MPCRSICCAGHDDSSRDMLNGNGFATSRSPMSFEVFDIERGRWDSMLNWRTKVVVDFGSEATSSEGDRAGRPRAPLCKSHGCKQISSLPRLPGCGPSEDVTGLECLA